VLALPPYSPDLAPCDYWLFSHVKEHLRGKRFVSEDNINTAVTASLKRPSKNEYRAAIDRLPSRWEKCVDSAGDYIE
jgi:transposase